MAFRNKLGRSKAGQHITPVAFRDSKGLFIGHNQQGWLYRVLPQTPLLWAEPESRNEASANLAATLIDLGRTSRAPTVAGTNIGADYREAHLVALSWNEHVQIPEDTPAAQAEWLKPVFDGFRASDSLVALGVKLRTGRSVGKQSPLQIVKDELNSGIGSSFDHQIFAADRAVVSELLRRSDAAIPTTEQQNRLEFWFNGGSPVETVVEATDDGRAISCDAWPEGLEMSTLYDYEEDIMDPDLLWLAEAFSHVNGCVCASVRFQLWPAHTARLQFRRTERKALDRLKDQQQTGDIPRDEDVALFETAKMLEDAFTEGEEPLIRSAGFIFAQRATYTDSTFLDHLERRFGLKLKAIEYRQLAALEETLPTASLRVSSQKSFRHDLTVNVLACSGITAANRLGDDSGIWFGVTTPDMSAVFLDPEGAAKDNKPPAMAVIGEPGAGKTFVLQSFATQAAKRNVKTVMINPKPADSLDGFCAEIGGETIKVSALEHEEGLLDPFRFAKPDIAAEIALSHIACVLPLSDAEMIEVGAALKAAAQEGGRCVGDALQHPEMPERATHLITKLATSDTLFRLGVAFRPSEATVLGGEAGLTLVEFDRPIPLPPTAMPTREMEPPMRSAVAAVRLITRAAVEQMLNSGGGVLIVDEAHVFLGSQEGRAMLQRIGREGRSQRILPIL